MYSVVGGDGQVYGPVDMATLERWIAEGRILATTELVDPLDGSRLPASMAPALMGRFADPGAYPRPAYGAPVGVPPYGAAPPKSKVVALVLALFLGYLGVHRFYLGHLAYGIGMVALFLLGFVSCFISWIPLGIMILVDLILVATGALSDAERHPLGP